MSNLETVIPGAHKRAVVAARKAADEAYKQTQGDHASVVKAYKEAYEKELREENP